MFKSNSGLSGKSKVCACNTFKAARVLVQNGFWNSAINRLYYSVFYAVNALLVLNGIDSKLDKFYVHASPYSIPIYKKLGFIETDKILEENGIKYLPMEMTIKK